MRKQIKMELVLDERLQNRKYAYTCLYLYYISTVSWDIFVINYHIFF